ncbi:MAG TPA: winged helix-turn-helix domain-containing protein [Vicinamibacterales bacterium]|nr:winged helix-turn-helix domain-containing protein [Vicinamibacterales bacterium]
MKLDIIDDPRRARTALHPLRARILGSLDRPASASHLAKALALPRQRVNYHLRQLEAEHLVQAEDLGTVGRRIDRQYRRTAASFLLAPTVPGTPAVAAQHADRFSSAYLAAGAARTLSDIAVLRRAADAQAKRIPTLSIEADVRFATPSAQRAFADALTSAVGKLVARYHDPHAPGGRTFRIFAGGYPAVGDPEKEHQHV